MSMISELIEKLIDNADLYTKELHDLMYEAAGTIEMLSEKAREPKQGEWIYCEDDEGQDGYRCSECGFFVPWYYGYEDINYIYKYHACPSCMAMMKGADGED